MKRLIETLCYTVIILLLSWSICGYYLFSVNKRICEVKFPTINSYDCTLTLHKLELISVIQSE